MDSWLDIQSRTKPKTHSACTPWSELSSLPSLPGQVWPSSGGITLSFPRAAPSCPRVILIQEGTKIGEHFSKKKFELSLKFWVIATSWSRICKPERLIALVLRTILKLFFFHNFTSSLQQMNLFPASAADDVPGGLAEIPFLFPKLFAFQDNQNNLFFFFRFRGSALLLGILLWTSNFEWE